MRDDQPGGFGADHDHRLLIHGIQDRTSPGGVPAGSMLCEFRVDPGLAGMLQLGRGGSGGEDFEHRIMLQPGANHALQAGVDLGE